MLMNLTTQMTKSELTMLPQECGSILSGTAGVALSERRATGSSESWNVVAHALRGPVATYPGAGAPISDLFLELSGAVLSDLSDAVRSDAVRSDAARVDAAADQFAQPILAPAYELVDRAIDETAGTRIVEAPGTTSVTDPSDTTAITLTSTTAADHGRPLG